MIVKVRTDACAGHARCAAVAAEVYAVDQNGFNVTAEKEVEEMLRAPALRGQRACPEKIISIDGQNN